VNAREELIGLVRTLSDEDANDVLEYVRSLLLDEDEELTSKEWEAVRLGEEQIARGESITLDDYLNQHGR
jgi:hypothetical protein